MDTINITPYATLFSGPKAVGVFRFAALISALRLESKGMKMSRGRSALSIAKEITGLKTRKHAEHIARLEILLANAKREVAYVETVTP